MVTDKTCVQLDAAVLLDGPERWKEDGFVTSITDDGPRHATVPCDALYSIERVKIVFERTTPKPDHITLPTNTEHNCKIHTGSRIPATTYKYQATI